MFMGVGGFFFIYLNYIGFVGMYGICVFNYVVLYCDFLIVVGVRFLDRVISKVDRFVLNVKIIYIDIDLVEIDKNVSIDIVFVGDVK